MYKRSDKLQLSFAAKRCSQRHGCRRGCPANMFGRSLNIDGVVKQLDRVGHLVALLARRFDPLAEGAALRAAF
eukprot:5272756-Lingulodinium_polyedra.AAC.1